MLSCFTCVSPEIYQCLKVSTHHFDCHSSRPRAIVSAFCSLDRRWGRIGPRLRKQQSLPQRLQEIPVPELENEQHKQFSRTVASPPEVIIKNPGNAGPLEISALPGS